MLGDERFQNVTALQDTVRPLLLLAFECCLVGTSALVSLELFIYFFVMFLEECEVFFIIAKPTEEWRKKVG